MCKAPTMNKPATAEHTMKAYVESINWRNIGKSENHMNR